MRPRAALISIAGATALPGVSGFVASDTNLNASNATVSERYAVAAK